MTPETIGLTVNTGLIAFLVAGLSGPLASVKFFNRPILLLLHGLGLAAALYLFVGGTIMLLEGWEDPLSNTDTSGITTSRRRGGLVMLLVSYAPYVMLGVGALFFYVHSGFLRAMNRR